MADNVNVKNAAAATVAAAADELSDSSFSPKVSVLRGDQTTVPISPAERIVAIAHGTNPTAVAAAAGSPWYTNRAGIPFVMGGHPNVITRAHIVTDGDGAQTDAILLTVGSGAKAVITRMTVICDNANTGDVAVTIGFGTANVPTVTLAGVAGVVVNGSFDGGAGVTLGDGSGILAVGADNEDLRLTCSDPVAGNLRISYSYYTIET